VGQDNPVTGWRTAFSPAVLQPVTVGAGEKPTVSRRLADLNDVLVYSLFAFRPDTGETLLSKIHKAWPALLAERLC
jgi:hypothetical protein